MITIRLASPDDAPSMSLLRSESIKHFAPKSYSKEIVSDWAQVVDPSRYIDAMATTETIHVAEEDNLLVGFGSINLDNKEIQNIYVHPNHARKGIGSMLLLELESFARRNSVKELSLSSSLNAVPFYESRGYMAGKAIKKASDRSDQYLEYEYVPMFKAINR